MNALSTPVRRLLALALLVMVFALPYRFFVGPAIEQYADLQEQADLYRGLIARYRSVAATQDSIAEDLEATRREADTTSAYLSGESNAIVAANLQERINGVIEANGGLLTTTQILPVVLENGFTRIGVRVRMTVDIGALQRIVYTIEAQQPALFVDNVDVNARARRQRVVAGSTPTEDALDVSLDIYGFAR